MPPNCNSSSCISKSDICMPWIISFISRSDNSIPCCSFSCSSFRLDCLLLSSSFLNISFTVNFLNTVSPHHCPSVKYCHSLYGLEIITLFRMCLPPFKALLYLFFCHHSLIQQAFVLFDLSFSFIVSLIYVAVN